MRPMTRAQPLGPAAAYKTYALLQPKATHTRPATCREAQCGHYLNGWATTVIAFGPDEAVIRQSGRKIATEEVQEGGFVRFTFHAGQPCFAAARHTLPVGREPLYVVRGGDWRGNPRGDRMRHTSAADWVDDFANHQQKLADRLAQG